MRNAFFVSLALILGTLNPAPDFDPKLWQDLRWRNVGPTRGGRVTAITGVRSQPCIFYMGGTGGGVWKTENCGESWTAISDGQIATGSIGSWVPPAVTTIFFPTRSSDRATTRPAAA